MNNPKKINTIKKALYPVGGLGTRFLPATKVMPKEMLPVVDKPLIQYSFEEALEAGCEQHIFITGRNKNVLMNHFDHSYELQRILSSQEKKHQLSLTRDWLPQPGQIAFIRQQEPLGLGHAVWCARNFIGSEESFAVLLADEMLIPDGEPSLNQMVKVHKKTGANVVAVYPVPAEKTSSYGIIAHKGKGDVLQVTKMVEKPAPKDAPSNLSLIGRYILNADIFHYLEKGQRGAGGEIQLTDAMQRMIEDGHEFYAVVCHGQRFDCGSRRGYVEANIGYALENPELHDSMVETMQRFLKKAKKK